jgi:hypothetical protein
MLSNQALCELQYISAELMNHSCLLCILNEFYINCSAKLVF